MNATRPIFWNVTGQSLMDVLAILAFVIFSLGLFKKLWVWNQGRKTSSYVNPLLRLRSFFRDLILHNKMVFKSKFRRLAHLGIFYGFIVLLIGTLVIAIQDNFRIPLFSGKFYLILSLLLDLFGLAALIGIVLAVFKRYLNEKHDRAKNSLDDAFSLILVFLVLITGFVIEGLRIYTTSDIWAAWTPVGLSFAFLAESLGLPAAAARSVHAFLWYLHMLLAFGFIAYIPYSKLFHMFASALNIFLGPSSRRGVLSPVETGSGQTSSIGIARLEDLSKKQLIELDACLSCLRCEKQCPAYLNGEPLSPREMVQALKNHSKQQFSFWGKKVTAFDSQLINKVVSQETLLSCSLCGLCEEKCPVQIEHMTRIVDMRRSLMSQVNNYPKEIQELFQNLLQAGNPWGLSPGSKAGWAPELRVPFITEKQATDVLYWVGCFGTYESRNTRVARSMFQILNKSGVDYAVLGMEEKCCGDSARRLGNETLFQHLAAQNIEVLNLYKFNTIVTHCPHCFNTLKNEYPQFGGNYRVLHHSQFIWQLIESGRIKPKAAGKIRITYHDPCYLGRINSINNPPRQILSSIPGLELIEMKNNRSKSLCCGAGGGRIWLKEKHDATRAQEAVKTKPDIIASACSLCLTSLTEAVSSLDADIRNLDIAEIIYDVL